MDAAERLNEVTRLFLEREKATSIVASIDRKIAEIMGIKTDTGQRKPSRKTRTSNQFREACRSAAQ